MAPCRSSPTPQRSGRSTPSCGRSTSERSGGSLPGHERAHRFERVFGGQTVAQALHAACATIDDKAPHSFHAYFVRSG
jgi:acyl-CoA thioesterase